MTLPDFLFCAFSLMGLWLVPASLGRTAWTVLLAFTGLGLMLLVMPAPLHPARNGWTGLALSQGPWILLAFDLAARGRVSRELDRVPLRELLAFALVHLTALRHIPAAAHGELPALFAVETAFAGALLSAGALLLWALYRPAALWYRALLVLWNTWGLMATVQSGFRIQAAGPEFPLAGWASPSREVHAYFTGWPGALDAFFWIPLAISIHLAVFYNIFRGGRPGAPAPETPPVSSVSSTS